MNACAVFRFDTVPAPNREWLVLVFHFRTEGPLENGSDGDQFGTMDGADGSVSEPRSVFAREPHKLSEGINSTCRLIFWLLRFDGFHAT